jgi:chemotaxis protein methyltransferase CheR
VISSTDYEFLQRFLKERSGLVLGEDKHYLLETRLLPLVRKFELGSLGQLVARLREPGGGAVQGAVVDAMTTNESFFFRDKTPFEAFTALMLPQLLRARSPAQPIRIWCAAASTGQEPYSLAMLLRENAAKVAGRRVEIVATDLSGEVLERARSGIYTQFEVQRGLPVQLLMKYFSKDGETWQLSPDIRKMVDFRHANLLKSFTALGMFDIVYCRNVLIYFDAATKTDVLDRIGKVLRSDGYLVLGGAETVVGLTDAYKPVAAQRSVYSPAPAQAAALALAR